MHGVAKSRLDISNLLLPLHLVSELNLGWSLITLWGEKDYDKYKNAPSHQIAAHCRKKLVFKNHICNLVRLLWVHLMSDSSWRCYLLHLIFDFTWSLGNWENDPSKTKLALDLLWSPSMDAGGASKPQRHSQLADLQKRLSLPICKILILSISLFVYTIMCKSTILNCKQVSSSDSKVRNISFVRLYALCLEMTQVRRWLNLVARSVFCGFTLSASLLLSTSTAFQSGPCDQDEDGDGLKEAEKQWQEGMSFFVVGPFLSLSPWELAAMSSLAQWWPEWGGWVFRGLSWLRLKKKGGWFSWFFEMMARRRWVFGG